MNQEQETGSLDEWWESEPDVQLTRSDWSVILETLIEQASMDELGDWIDKKGGQERRRIVSRVRNQADIQPPPELTRAAYGEEEDA